MASSSCKQQQANKIQLRLIVNKRRKKNRTHGREGCGAEGVEAERWAVHFPLFCFRHRCAHRLRLFAPFFFFLLPQKKEKQMVSVRLGFTHCTTYRNEHLITVLASSVPEPPNVLPALPPFFFFVGVLLYKREQQLKKKKRAVEICEQRKTTASNDQRQSASHLQFETLCRALATEQVRP